MSHKIFEKKSKQRVAGILLYNDNKVFLVYEKGKWGIPKGKLDKGESDLEAAMRELHEETGVKLKKSKYDFVDLGDFKNKRFYALEYKKEINFKPNDEIDDAKWVKLSKVNDKIRKDQKEVIKKFKKLVKTKKS